jgi:hypothetical protein
MARTQTTNHSTPILDQALAGGVLVARSALVSSSAASRHPLTLEDAHISSVRGRAIRSTGPHESRRAFFGSLLETSDESDVSSGET